MSIGVLGVHWPPVGNLQRTNNNNQQQKNKRRCTFHSCGSDVTDKREIECSPCKNEVAKNTVKLPRMRRNGQTNTKVARFEWWPEMNTDNSFLNRTEFRTRSSTLHTTRLHSIALLLSRMSSRGTTARNNCQSLVSIKLLTPQLCSCRCARVCGVCTSEPNTTHTHHT